MDDRMQQAQDLRGNALALGGIAGYLMSPS
jgi:hypothetical protein